MSDPSEVRRAWEAFVGYGVPPDDTIPKMVVRSWMRCAPRIPAQSRTPPSVLLGDSLLASQVNSFDLMVVARPVMEDIYQFVEGSETALVLTNAASYIMDVLGDSSMVGALRGLGLIQGASVAESVLGTNALALSLIERTPVRVSGAEHYLECLQDLADAAAPVFDAGGEPLGVLGAFTWAWNAHSHGLGMVVAGAKAIEGQLQADTLLGEYNVRLTELNALLEAFTDGILVWDRQGTVVHANAAAAELVGKPEHALMGRPRRPYLHFSSHVESLLSRGQPVDQFETRLYADGDSLAVILSSRRLQVPGLGTMTMVSFKKAEEGRHLIQAQLASPFPIGIDSVVGGSANLERARRTARAAAGATACVFIQGPRGSGKTLLAHAIHGSGERKSGPFMLYACASVPRGLAVAELCGTVEGMFSPGGEARPGMMELADGGTLYLQDVDQLPLEAQTVLVRMIELGIVQRVGSRVPIELDVRVVASSRVDLRERVAEGTFLPDLYSRLSVFRIALDPLKERQEDIPLIAETVLRRFSLGRGRPLRMDEQVVEALAAYDWPGNVRELEEVLEAAVARLGTESVIRSLHLPEKILARGSSAPSPRLDGQGLDLENLEREAFTRAAEVTQGSVTGMAALLGVSRTSVWRRAKRWGVDLREFKANSQDPTDVAL